MASSSELRSKRNAYMKCLNGAIATANNLQMAINILNSLINTQNGSYKIDDSPADGNYLNRLKTKEEKIHSNIVNNVIPGTRAIIDNLEYQILDAEAREALEAS